MQIEKHPYYDYGTFTIKLDFEEFIFLDTEDGPQIGVSQENFCIETKTHDVEINRSTGEIKVRKNDWRDLYPVDDSIFGVVDTSDNRKVDKKSESKIQPCPFCASDEASLKKSQISAGAASVQCPCCDAQGPSDDAVEAVRRWNKWSE